MHITIVKAVDKLFADIGDILTFTSNINNTSNSVANNILFQDKIPVGTSFVSGSLEVNGVGYIDEPIGGVLKVGVGILNPGGTTVVKFQVKVEGLLNPIVVNSSQASYTIIDRENPISETATSNETKTAINTAILSGSNFKKEVDKLYASLGDEIEYRLNITNGGNVPANNIVVKDVIQPGGEFVLGTVYINGILAPSADPTVGISIDSLLPSKSTSLRFRVKVLSIPPTNYINDKGTLSYSYNVSPDRVVNADATSNEVKTEIKTAIVECYKEANKSFANLGDKISYDIVLTNTGNVAAINVGVKDAIESYGKFVEGSLKVNGVLIPSGNIQAGIIIPNINVNQNAVVSYDVLVVGIPQDGTLDNQGDISYSYTLNPNNPPINKNIKTNVVKVTVQDVDFQGDNFKKSTYDEVAAINETISYSLKIKNAGNVQAFDVVFVDTIPNGAKFVENSLKVDGVTVVSENPEAGVSLGSMNPSDEKAISFDILVVSIPNSNEIRNKGVLKYTVAAGPSNGTNEVVYSNEVVTKINSPEMKIVKGVSTNYVAVGYKATYSITVENLGNILAECVEVRDILSSELEFQNGSVKVNGKSVTGNIINGIDIGNLKPNESKVITFDVKVLGYPPSGVIINQSACYYKYLLEPDTPYRLGEKVSNEVPLNIVIADVFMTKESDNKEVTLDSTAEYTITILNKGNVDVFEFIFKDTMEPKVEFITESFSIDGKSVRGVDLNQGINIGKIKVGQRVLIAYRVKVIDASSRCALVNEAYGSYKFIPGPNAAIDHGETNKASAKVLVRGQSFKQLAVDGKAFVPLCNPPIEEIDETTTEIEILDSHVVRTLVGVSNSNQRISGYKLVVNGMIHQQIEYTALVDDRSVHIVDAHTRFSTFIVLPENFSYGKYVDIQSLVEDVSSNLVNDREIFISTTFTLNVDIK